MTRRVLFIGAIILTGVMAFKIYISIFIIFILLSLFLTFTLLYDLKSKYILLLALYLFAGSLGYIRYNSNRDFIPFNKREVIKVDLIITKDSRKVKGGYLVNGLITKYYGISIISPAREEVFVYSKSELTKGDKVLYVPYRNRISITDERVVPLGGKSLRSYLLVWLSGRIDSGLLFAMITGNKNRLNSELLSDFRESGLSHILALSGFHLGIVILLVHLIMKPLFTNKVIYLVTSLILTLYIYTIGPSPSLIRSFIMYLVGITYKSVKGRVDIKSSYLISYLISLLLFPEEFTSLSFLLSYLSLFGIIYLSPMLLDLYLFSIFPKVLSGGLSASISAILSTGLLLIIVFGEVFPIGIISSSIISPIIVIYMFVGILSIVIAPLQKLILLLDLLITRLCGYFSTYPSISVKDENIYLATFIFIALPVILYLVTMLRSRDIGRFNTEFKL